MKNQKLLWNIIFYTVISLLGFIMIYPILWLVISSFKSPLFINQDAASLIPKGFNIQNYIEGWRGFGGIGFNTFFANSFFITIISTVAQVFSSAVIAFGFARIEFKFKSIWFICMLLTLMLPAQVLTIPQYIMYSSWGIKDSYLPIILPSFFGTAFFIFMIMQFIQGIPYELDESAYIDGCSNYTIFYRIVLPLIKPALMTSAIFAFYWKWEDFFGPLLYIQSITKYTISLALKMFSDPAAVSNWGALYAMSSLSILPVILIFFCFQKYLVEGISTTGLKG